MIPRRYAVCQVADLTGGRVRTTKLFARTIAVFELNGVIKAVDGLCRHMNMPLFQNGLPDGTVITCPFHGWQYDLTSLVCVGKPEVHLREYDVVVEDGRVFVSVPRQTEAT